MTWGSQVVLVSVQLATLLLALAYAVSNLASDQARDLPAYLVLMMAVGLNVVMGLRLREIEKRIHEPGRGKPPQRQVAG